MKTVHIQIEKYGYDKYTEYDNVVSRDELIHDLLAKNIDYKRDRAGKEFDWDNGVYITWYDGTTEDAQKQRAALATDAGEAPAPAPAPAPKADEAEGEDAG